MDNRGLGSRLGTAEPLKLIGRSKDKAPLRRVAMWLSVVSLIVPIALASPTGAAVSRPTSFGHDVKKGLTTEKASASVIGGAVVSASLTGSADMGPILISSSAPIAVNSSNGTYLSQSVAFGVGPETDVHPNATYQDTGCADDDTYSVEVCLVINFNIKSDSYNYFADNEEDGFEAINLDSHDVVLESLSMSAGGYGEACNGGGFLEPPTTPETWSKTSPVSGTTYNEIPSWHGNYYRLYSDGNNIQSTSATLDWDYRSSPEVFDTSFQLPDSGTGWPMGGCSN